MVRPTRGIWSQSSTEEHPANRLHDSHYLSLPRDWWCTIVSLLARHALDAVSLVVSGFLA